MIADPGRLLIILGLLFLLLGIIVSLLGGVLPFGRLPGDLRFQVGGARIYAPIVSCLLLSIVLTLLANALLRLFGR